MDKAITFIVVIAASLVGIILYKRKRKTNYEKEIINELTLENILEWFRRDDIQRLLQQSDDYKAIVIREEELKGVSTDFKEEKSYIFQCIFDSKSESIIYGRLIKYEKISDDLLKIFGNKSMIVFE